MKKQWILAVAALLSLASCGSYKKLTYLQDMEVLTTYDVKEQPNVLIGVNDKLRIVVTCQEPTLAAMKSACSMKDASWSAAPTRNS